MNSNEPKLARTRFRTGLDTIVSREGPPPNHPQANKDALQAAAAQDAVMYRRNRTDPSGDTVKALKQAMERQKAARLAAKAAERAEDEAVRKAEERIQKLRAEAAQRAREKNLRQAQENAQRLADEAAQRAKDEALRQADEAVRLKQEREDRRRGAIERGIAKYFARKARERKEKEQKTSQKNVVAFPNTGRAISPDATLSFKKAVLPAEKPALQPHFDAGDYMITYAPGRGEPARINDGDRGLRETHYQILLDIFNQRGKRMTAADIGKKYYPDHKRPAGTAYAAVFTIRKTLKEKVEGGEDLILTAEEGGFVYVGPRASKP
jgi:hypothetical protein